MSSLTRIAPVQLSGLLSALLGAVCCAPAHAELSDTIHPYVSVARNYDANLFRLPDSAPAFSGDRSDTSTQYRAGILFERPIGRQKLSGRVEASRVTFATNDELDYNGKNGQADLEWYIGNHLTGHAGLTYAQELTSFSDFHVSERNLRVQRRGYANGGWTFHPSWRVRAGYNEQKSTYSLPSQRFNDRTEEDGNVGLDYFVASGSLIGLQLGRAKGRYPNHVLAGGLPVDDSYTQNEAKLNVLWVFSATSQFQMLAGRARREHTYSNARDSSGVNGTANFNWSMLRKLRMNSSVWRRYAAVESVAVSNSMNTGALVSADWDITGKIGAQFSARSEKRDFIPIPGVTVLRDFDDRTRTVSAGVTYQPTRQIQLGLSLFNERRSGNAQTNYRTHGTSFNASVQF